MITKIAGPVQTVERHRLLKYAQCMHLQARSKGYVPFWVITGAKNKFVKRVVKMTMPALTVKLENNVDT